MPETHNVVVSRKVRERRLMCVCVGGGGIPLTSAFSRPPTDGPPRRAVTTHDDSAAADERRAGGRRVRKNRWPRTDMSCACVRARFGLELLDALDGGTRRRRRRENITSGRARGFHGESDANDGFRWTARKWLARRPPVCAVRERERNQN